MRVIVNAAICSETSWYIKGQDRLRQSLLDVGETAFLAFTQYEELILHSVYEDKILAIKNAVLAGAKRLIWLDCSITAVKSLEPIWEYIEKHGYYLYESGSRCDITCNDHSLKCYGVTRDTAKLFYECASNVVGINLDNYIGKRFYELWIQSLEDGSNLGLKWPNESQRLQESKDERFKYHRQDQSTASLSAGVLGLKLEKEGEWVSRYENENKKETTILILKGGE